MPRITHHTLRAALVLCLLGASAWRARAADEALDPLYRRIAADLRAGQPLVVTVHVALCDNRVIWCGHRGFGDGDAPRRNLYWGGAGLRAYFDRARGYRRLLLDGGDGQTILERAVYVARVSRPAAAWRQRGVDRAFDVLLVALAYRGTRIAQASAAFLEDVAAGPGAELTLSDGRRIAYGGRGHVVGYAGHNHLLDVAEPRVPAVRRRDPVGYFALSCLNARFLARPFADPRTRGLLLTRSLMFPGAFTIDGLIGGIAAGEPQHEVFGRGAAMYARFQRRPERAIRAAFIHDGEPRFARQLLRAPPR